MGIGEAAMWGMAGGAVAGLVTLSASIAAANFRWPWRRPPDGDGLWPYLLVGAINLGVGAIVAAATHGQIDGAWPAPMQGDGSHAEQVLLLPDASGQIVRLSFDSGAPEDMNQLEDRYSRKLLPQGML